MSGQASLHTMLGQMLAVLQAERQALAAIDLDAILGAAIDKRDLCGRLAAADAASNDDHGLDAESRALIEAARRLNETNRQIRNLLAANVAARIDALVGPASAYRPAMSRRPACSLVRA